MNTIRGFQDILPEEMERRRTCEDQLTRVFKQWGYQEIDTPTLEYYDVLMKGIGPELKEKMFKLLNADGEIIVLRPDMTTPIARVAATRLQKKKDDFYKFYYLNHVFRKVDHNTDDQQEFHQAGIELLGLNNRLADAEVIAVAINALRNAGLDDFCLDIGSAGFFNALMNKLPLVAEYKKILRQTIMNKDFVLLEELLSQYDLPRKNKEMILHLPQWRGDESIIADAEKMIGQNDATASLALQEIREVYRYLQMYGLEKYILIDLGIIRNFDYYTGIVFEGYTSCSGSAICGGGRYDYLCSQFGKDIPATGVAIGIERLLRALTLVNKAEKEELNSQRYFIRYRKEFVGSAFRLAERLRNRNLWVETELEVARTKEKAIQYALGKKVRFLIEIESEDDAGFLQYDLLKNLEKRVVY